MKNKNIIFVGIFIAILIAGGMLFATHHGDRMVLDHSIAEEQHSAGHDAHDENDEDAHD